MVVSRSGPKGVGAGSGALDALGGSTERRTHIRRVDDAGMRRTNCTDSCFQMTRTTSSAHTCRVTFRLTLFMRLLVDDSLVRVLVLMIQ